MIEGAITFQEATSKEEMTQISQVNFTIEMDSVLTKRTMKFMRKCPRFIPIIEYGDKNRIIGVLNAQSCLGVDPDENKTLKQLYIEREIDIRIPLYLPQSCNLARVGYHFKKGEARLAVVCKNAESAQKCRNYADSFHNSIKPGVNAKLVDSHDFVGDEVVGIITLKDVLERVLMTDIAEAYDPEQLKQGMNDRTHSARASSMNDAASSMSAMD